VFGIQSLLSCSPRLGRVLGKGLVIGALTTRLLHQGGAEPEHFRQETEEVDETAGERKKHHIPKQKARPGWSSAKQEGERGERREARG